ncbi:hypothetical protein [Marmoricola sp. RAF53]|uniref:hypothetical protein n=1 Tax=Marmoricola sp. RAF53 TaxID=3233059 RepID=UPI003F94999E
MSTEHDLTEALSHEAERFTRKEAAAVSLDGVLARAGEIRRGRRLRATLAMAAVVLAVAVPVGIKVLDDPAAPPRPPVPAVTPDPSPLSLDNLPTGQAPKVTYAEGGTLHDPDGGTFDLGARPSYLARFDGGVLIGADDRVRVQGVSGNSSGTRPLSGGFAVSPAGHVAAFAQPDGTVVAVQGENGEFTDLGRITGAGTGGLEIAAVDGGCDRALDDGCTVYVNQRDEHSRVWALTPGAAPEVERRGLITLVDLSSRGRFAGYTKVTDDGSCSGLVEPDGTLWWSTCEHRFFSFSPDGKRLVGAGPYGDGAGDGRLAVLDTDSGKTRLELSTTTAAVITQTRWEDQDHVLAVVLQGDRAAVLRIGLSGEREYAVVPVKVTEDYVAPFLLADR